MIQRWNIPQGMTVRACAAGQFVGAEDHDQLARALTAALMLTESNLRRLIAAQHHDKVLMEPWLREVSKALDLRKRLENPVDMRKRLVHNSSIESGASHDHEPENQPRDSLEDAERHDSAGGD